MIQKHSKSHYSPLTKINQNLPTTRNVHQGSHCGLIKPPPSQAPRRLTRCFASRWLVQGLFLGMADP